MAVANGRRNNQTRRDWFEGSSIIRVSDFSAEEWAGVIKNSGFANFCRIQLEFCPRSDLSVILLSIKWAITSGYRQPSSPMSCMRTTRRGPWTP